MAAHNRQIEELTFADMLNRLDEISKLLDNGEVSLEQSLELFEEGSGLIKKCNSMIADARLKITEISANTEGNENV